MSDGDRVIEDLGQWDWSLRVTPTGDVIARKPIKYDGILTFSTEDRPVSNRARSETQLAPSDVIDAYAARSDTEIPKPELTRQVILANEAVYDLDGEDET